MIKVESLHTRPFIRRFGYCWFNDVAKTHTTVDSQTHYFKLATMSSREAIVKRVEILLCQLIAGRGTR